MTGLCKLLTDVQSFDEAMEQSAAGTKSKVNLMVTDLSPDSASFIRVL